MPDVPCCEIRMIRTASSGLRPYLLVEGVPVILANLWAEDLLHKSRLNTVESYLRDVAVAYEWALSRDSPLERKLERLAVFSSTELTMLAERLCSTRRGAEASQSTCTRRLESIKSFIDFSFDHYIELNRLGLQEQSQAEKNKNKNLRNLSRGCTPESQKFPSAQLQSRHERIQVDELAVSLEGVMPVQQDVPPGRWRHLRDQRQRLGIASCLVLRQQQGQDRRVVEDDRVADQPGALVADLDFDVGAAGQFLLPTDLGDGRA